MMKLKVLVSAIALISLSANAADEEMVRTALDAALNLQKVYIEAPGFPSRVHDMALCVEDPNAEANLKKQYHPAARQGWLRMTSFARALSKNGWFDLDEGTFFDRDLYNRPFKYTGYLINVTDKLKDYVAVVPNDGRVLLRAGVSAVDRIVSIKNNGKSTLVTFTTTLGNPSPWLDENTIKYANPKALLGGEESATLSCDTHRCKVTDEKFLDSLTRPLTDSGD